MLSLISSKQMTNRRSPIHSLSQLAPIYFGTQSGAIWGNPLTIYYRVRAVSVDGVRSLPSATPSQCRSPMPPRFRQACRRSRRLAEQLCSFHSLWIGRILRTRRCRATTSRIQHKSQFHARYHGSGVEPKPLRLHDHAGSARAGKLFLACARTARRRRRSLVGWARDHGDGSRSLRRM